MTLANKPVPEPDDLTKPFWEAVDRQQLMVQQCASCQRMQHPPLATCRHCGAGELAWRALSGRGIVHSHQLVHDSRIPQFREIQPYVIMVVEAIESPHVLFIANLLPGDARPSIGDPVGVAYQELAPGGHFLPQFRLSAGEVR